MPVYLYACPTCARRYDVVKKLADIDTPTICHHCGFTMNRQIAAPMVRGDYAGYSCPITGKWIEGRKAHAENLARHGCRVLDNGEKEAMISAQRQAEQELDKAVDTSVGTMIESMPTEKREALEAAASHGLTAEIVRTSPGN